SIPQKRDFFIEINPENYLVKGLAAAIGVLVICHLLGEILNWPAWIYQLLFHLDREGTIATWFSSILWALNASIAVGCAVAVKNKREERIWLGVAVIFGLFSLDETAMIHERLGESLTHFLWGDEAAHIYHAVKWPFLLAPIVLGVFVVFISSFVHCLRNNRRALCQVLYGLGLVFFGAFGLETMVGSGYFFSGPLQWLLKIEVVFEETLEMLGALCILSGLLSYKKDSFLRAN
ncbi:MAG: hypothetical protein HY351_01400, partial [Candidatus Omnitrophica bacterium]|nr:hypothetical protein [Candidatus Omnitrophota bacterium]